MGPVTAVVLGAGSRGFGYSNFALSDPGKLKIVAVAEPIEVKRKAFAAQHKIPDHYVFETWEQVKSLDKMADCVLITTMDQMHKDPAISLAKKGYNIFLEKPMAISYKDCKEIVEVCRNQKVILAVGHVLRYDLHSLLIRELIEKGVLGTIVNIQHLEPIGYWHFCHSFVRGNWRNKSKSSFLLLTKCCHDIDLIEMWMKDQSEVSSVSSFGSLVHFNKKNKPSKASNRCLTCIEEPRCPFSAKKIYLKPVEKGNKGYPTNVITFDPTPDKVMEALMEGPYGKCVYDCDNDVCDNQVVILQYKNGATVTLTTTAFTEKVCERKVTIYGTKGELNCDYGSPTVQFYEFSTNKKVNYSVSGKIGGHNEADLSSIKSFISAIQKNDESYILAGPEESLNSHKLCFIAEMSRNQHRVIDIHHFDCDQI